MFKFLLQTRARGVAGQKAKWRGSEPPQQRWGGRGWSSWQGEGGRSGAAKLRVIPVSSDLGEGQHSSPALPRISKY